MSNRALNWAFDSGLPSGPRFVLVVLGDAGTDHSGEDWTCFPSVARIMEMTGMGRSTVERHLSWLWSEGWISREPRKRKDGTLGINDYVLHRRPETRAALKAERASIPARPGRRPTLNMRDGETLKSAVSNPQIGDQQTLNLRGQEPSDDPSDQPTSSAREPGDDGFDEVCGLWPYKGRKFTRWPAARAAWARACQVETPERLRHAVEACARDPDRIKGDHGWPGLDVFLRDEIWRSYLPGAAEGPSEGAAAKPVRRFEGPCELRAEIVALTDEGFAASYLDRAAWDPETRTIRPHGRTAHANLTARAGRIIRKHGAQLAPIGETA